MVAEDGDYWRDGVIMSIVDQCSVDAVAFAVMEAEDGPEFNNAVWAWIRLRDLTLAHYAVK